MRPNKAAVLVELKGGKPTFLGWRHPETAGAVIDPARCCRKAGALR